MVMRQAGEISLGELKKRREERAPVCNPRRRRAGGSVRSLSLKRIGAIFHEAAVPIEIVSPFNYAWSNAAPFTAREQSK
jgi:hypothetical protein